MVAVKEFPVNIITIECCENTFDDLLVNDKLDNNELTCIILQVLMILITYQKLFKFTHNDLHTNNIMYIKTEKKGFFFNKEIISTCLYEFTIELKKDFVVLKRTEN